MAFATVTDIRTRLEESALSTEASAAATLLIESATAVIAQSAGQTDAWAAALSPVPKILKALTIELVCRAMASPQGLSSATETLGAYSRSEDYRRDLSTALVLTPAEERLVQRVAGSGSGSVRVKALPHDVYVAE